MDKIIFHQLNIENFIGIITVLDYEIRLNQYLSELSFRIKDSTSNKVIVDLALKSGINQYRFVEFKIDCNGRIVLNNSNFLKVSNKIEMFANKILCERKDIVKNSMLPDSKKEEIIHMCI